MQDPSSYKLMGGGPDPSPPPRMCLLSTLTFAITFELLEVETSYLAYVLH